MVANSKSREEQSNQPILEPRASQKWWAMLGIGIGTFMFALDVYIVNIALPILMKSLHTSFATIQWVVLSYLLMLTVLVLGVARLGDMWGKKWLYFGGLVVFTLGSLLCGLAPTIGFLIGFRVLQGLGAVFMSALSTAMITEVFPQSERGRGLGMIGGIFLLGIALGPTVGGVLIALSGWRLIFLVNVPIGIIASFIVALVVPDSVSSETKQPFDGLGALIMTVTLTCFALGMTIGQIQGFGSLTALTLLILSTIGLGCFLAVEARVLEPMLDLAIFRSRKFSLSLLLSLMVYVVIAGVIFILPFFLELVKQYSTQQAGLMLAVSPILAGLMSPVAGNLSDRFGSRIVSLIGLVLMVGGCLAISTFDTELTVLGYIVRIAPYGLGVGMFLSSNNSAVMSAVPPERLGIASGLLSLSRTLGQMTGLPLMGALFSTLTIAYTVETEDATSLHIDITNAPVEALVFSVQTTFHIAAPVLMVSAILTALLWWQERSVTINVGET